MVIKVIKKIDNMFKTKQRPSWYVTYLVECSNCGKQFPMIKYDIWKTEYCINCANKIFKQSTIHWISSLDSRFADIYYGVMKRCYNKECKQYHNYWWRWIRCEWNSIETFKEDMYDSYKEHVKEFWERNTTLDRIDVNWNYCKENCRWATQREQCNNTRYNIKIKYKWKEYKSLQLLVDDLWLCYSTVWNRLKKWRTIEQAIETPKKK